MATLFIVYDNNSYIHWFPQNVAYLVSSCSDSTIYNQDIHHYNEEHLTRYLDTHDFSEVCLGFIGGYYQYRKAKEIAKAVNKSKNRSNFKFILGGHGPSPDPEFFLRKLDADIVVIGEGEEQLREITHGWMEIFIKGIAYLSDNIFVLNERRELSDINKIVWPRYNKFNIEYYRLIRAPNCDTSDFVMPVLSGRGCPYKCNFCYRMDKGRRERDIDHIIEEIKYLNRNYGINYIIFSDELLMTSKTRVEKICKKLKPLSIKWNCNGRLNIAAKHPSLLKLMKDSGCVFINYGIESFDDNALKLMNKKLTCKQIVDGVENTKKVGISPGLNIIFGNHGEDEFTLNSGVDFLLNYDDHAQLRTIRPVTPYPGSELYYDAIKLGLIKDIEDFYENKHVNSDLLTCNFTSMTDDDFYWCLLQANKRLINKYNEFKSHEVVNELEELYLNKNVNFRGFRQT